MITIPAEPHAGLSAFAEAIGLTNVHWAALESPTEIAIYQDVERAVVDRFSTSAFEALENTYGNAVRVAVFLDDWEIFPVEGELLETALEGMRRNLGGHTRPRLEIVVDKSALAQNWYGPADHEPRFLYLFADAARRQFASRLDQLEDRYWHDAGEKCTILIPAIEVSLRGPCLRILGRNANLDTGFTSTTLIDLVGIYTECRERTRWQDSWLKHLTPMHLELQGDQDSAGIYNTLRAQMLTLTLLYTADRSEINSEGRWVSTFQSSREAMQVPVPAVEDVGQMAIVGPLAHWAYDSGFSPDRFALVQGTMVTELRALPADVRFSEVARRESGLVAQMTWHLQAMIDGRLEEYSKQVRDLEDYVDKTANSFTDQISTMLNTVSQTVLAAIGVFFAALVATTFKNPFNIVAFIASMLAFAGYILLFPYLSVLKLQRERRAVLESEYQQRRERFASILYAGKVGDIEGQRITTAFRIFDRAYDRARNTYFALAGLSVLAAVVAFFLQGAPSQPLDGSPTTSTVRSIASQAPSSSPAVEAPTVGSVSTKP